MLSFLLLPLVLWDFFLFLAAVSQANEVISMISITQSILSLWRERECAGEGSRNPQSLLKAITKVFLSCRRNFFSFFALWDEGGQKCQQNILTNAKIGNPDTRLAFDISTRISHGASFFVWMLAERNKKCLRRQKEKLTWVIKSRGINRHNVSTLKL